MTHPSQLEDLVDYALSKSLVISVYDGGDWAVKKSSDRATILEHTRAVDESWLIIRDETTSVSVPVAKVFIVLGNEPETEVADCTDCTFMTEWSKQYEEKIA